MECPDCGYVLTPFDKECPRCKNIRRRRGGLARAPARVVSPEMALEPATAAMTARPVAEAVPAGACVVCGSGYVQRVAEIVGTAEETPGADDEETSRGHMFLPPPGPKFQNSYFTAGMVAAAGIIAFLIVANTAGGREGVAGLIALCSVAGALVYDLSQNGRARAAHADDLARWMYKMDIWNRTCFCAVCHHIYDPVTRKSAGAKQMTSLLEGGGRRMDVPSLGRLDAGDEENRDGALERSS